MKFKSGDIILQNYRKSPPVIFWGGSDFL